MSYEYIAHRNTYESTDPLVLDVYQGSVIYQNTTFAHYNVSHLYFNNPRRRNNFRNPLQEFYD